MGALRRIELHPNALPRIEDLDPKKLVLAYDSVSDTLFLHFYGRGRPAVSIEVAEDVFYRVDPETRDVVSIQVEHVLSQRPPEVLRR